jgi:hypothetical protein
MGEWEPQGARCGAWKGGDGTDPLETRLVRGSVGGGCGGSGSRHGETGMSSVVVRGEERNQELNKWSMSKRLSLLTSQSHFTVFGTAATAMHEPVDC